jgi:hypothetical protein
MTNPENIFQKWVWKGLEENFKPDGDLSIDENGCDIFKGRIFRGESFFYVFENGFEFKAGSLPEVLTRSMPGMKLKDAIEIPTSGDPDLDSIIQNSIIDKVQHGPKTIQISIRP